MARPEDTATEILPAKADAPRTATAGDASLIYISMAGDRIGAISDRVLSVFDRDAKELRVVPLSAIDDELLVRLRGDHV